MEIDRCVVESSNLYRAGGGVEEQQAMYEYVLGCCTTNLFAPRSNSLNYYEYMK